VKQPHLNDNNKCVTPWIQYSIIIVTGPGMPDIYKMKKECIMLTIKWIVVPYSILEIWADAT
jgi:hypothetical protein